MAQKQKTATLPSLPLTPPAIHARAKQHIPDVPIKDKSIWIAVLNHNITTLNEIKDRNAFLWIKANPEITARTIKFKYFERFPLDEVVMQQGVRIPGDFSPMRALRNTPDNLVAFRALVKESIKDELLLRDIKENENAVRPGDAKDKPINLDEDEELPDAAHCDEGETIQEPVSINDRSPVVIDVSSDSEEEEEEGKATDGLPIHAPSANFGNALKAKEQQAFQDQSELHQQWGQQGDQKEYPHDATKPESAPQYGCEASMASSHTVYNDCDNAQIYSTLPVTSFTAINTATEHMGPPMPQFGAWDLNYPQHSYGPYTQFDVFDPVDERAMHNGPPQDATVAPRQIFEPPPIHAFAAQVHQLTTAPVASASTGSNVALPGVGQPLLDEDTDMEADDEGDGRYYGHGSEEKGDEDYEEQEEGSDDASSV